MKKTKKKKPSPTKIEKHTKEIVLSDGNRKRYERNTSEIKHFTPKNNLNKIFSSIPLFLIWFKNFFN